MGLLDILKALGVALLLMVLNVAAAFGVMWVYGTFIETGHDVAFYEAAAQRIAPWSSIFAGGVLFFLAGWLFAKRKPDRNGLLFAAVFTLIYVAIDVGVIVAAGAVTSLGGIVLLSVVSKFIAALCGAFLAKRGAS